MTDISEFPTVRDVLVHGDNILNLTSSGAAKAGMVAAIDATGISMTVRPAVAEAGELPIGVYLYDVDANDPAAIAGEGCIVYVANADDTATGDAGDYLCTNDNTVGGTVSVQPEAGSGAKGVLNRNVIGFLVEDLAASGTARAMVHPMVITQPLA